MNEEKLYNAVSGIDEELLDRSLNSKKRRSVKTGVRLAVVAGIVILAVIASASAAIAAEAKEYSTALDFFMKNGLSAEGLSRSDIKAIYRDITQKKFTYEKTEEVIRLGVPGMEIAQRTLTPSELAALWDERRNGIPRESGNEIRYQTELLGGIGDGWILNCYRGGEQLWSAQFPEVYLADQFHTENGTFVWGQNNIHSSEERRFGFVALVNDEGEILWQHFPDHGFHNEWIQAVLQNEDGTFEVFSQGDSTYLCLSRYDLNGNETDFCNTDVICNIKNAVHLGDGYLVQEGRADLVRLDKNGKVMDRFTYEGKDCSYYLKDMVEYSGRIFLSAYAVPFQKSDKRPGYELNDVIDYIYSEGTEDISEEKLTPMVQKNYTAVLLLCDPESGIPQTFYSVKESLGAALSVNGAGQLDWEVERIASVFFSPYTSAYTFNGVSKVYHYTFDADGTLVGATDTGTTAAFWK